jgi:hypothetical protein
MTGSLRVVILISGLGHVVHNLEEFGFTMLALGQTVIPAAVTGLLFRAAVRPTRAYLVALGVWGLIVLVAGGGSVFPLPFLPFEPAQTVSHYLAHAVYAALQVPLLIVVWRALRRPESPHEPSIQ